MSVYTHTQASLVAQLVKNLPAMRETWVWIPGLGRSPGEDPWVRKIPWLPTPVFWPGEFHGLYSPWGRKESDTTERFSTLIFTYLHKDYKRLHCSQTTVRFFQNISTIINHFIVSVVALKEQRGQRTGLGFVFLRFEH